MTRLCGWVGFDAPEARCRELLGAMRGGASDGNGDDGVAWTGPGCALGVLTGATFVDTHRDDELWVAVEGPVRFEPPGAAWQPAERGVAARIAERYRAVGDAVLEHLHDAFALVVMRPKSGDALLAIDRIGGRHPLTYKVADRTLLFASSGAALQAHPLGRSEIDPQAIFNYVYFHVVPGPGTARRGVRRLMPGERLRFSNGVDRLDRYWQIAYLEQEKSTVETLAGQFRGAVRESVRREATPDVGCFLSGGTDSSTIAGFLGEVTERPARAYAIGFDAEGYDEMGYARTAAGHFGAELREYYVRPGDVVDAIPLIARAHAEPFGNASAVPAYYCAKMAREDGVRRLLAGDGGDELFAGNERYLRQRVFGLYGKLPAGVRRRLVEPLVNRFPAGDKVLPVRKARSYISQANTPMPQRLQSYNYLERTPLDSIFEPDFLAEVDTDRPLALWVEVYEAARAASQLNRMLALDMRFTLADNDLPKVSRSCALADVEVTYPLLGDDVVDFARRVPPRLNLRRGQLRWFFKHALRDFLPRAVLKKSKHGFGLPFGLWMRDDPRLREMALESVSALAHRSIVRRDYVDDVVRLHQTEHAVYYGVMIWVLVMLEQWFVAHVDDGPPELTA